MDPLVRDCQSIPEGQDNRAVRLTLEVQDIRNLYQTIVIKCSMNELFGPYNNLAYAGWSAGILHVFIYLFISNI